MTVAKLRWYAARLAAMSPAEVAHRFGELARKRAWRGNTRGWANFAATGDGAILQLEPLRQRLAAGWPAASPAFDIFNQGRLCGLGREVPEAPGPAVWFTDPVRGALWPGAERYCFDVDVRSTGETIGDVKFVWEINRLQFLHPLACAIAADPDDALIARAIDLIVDWRTSNPPFRGVNWVSGIELAMRMVSLTLAASAIPPERMSAGSRKLLRQLAAAHGFWLQRYPSRFSSANNHLVAEGLGLFLAANLAPDLPEARHWNAEGRAILEAEAARQILGDGVGAEQSPTYQAFTMEMLAFAALVAEMLHMPLAPIVHERLRAGAGFLRTLMDDAGGVPQIGDDDEGRVLAAPPDREPRYVASVTAAVAGLLGDDTLLPPSRHVHWRDALFAVPARTTRPEDGLKHFVEGGYSVGREEINGRRCVLTFDHGPLGYLSLAAHGHADALAIWLSIDDQPVIVDAGTFLYHSGRAMRAKLRASNVHNTLTVQNASQSQPSAAFSWSSKAAARLDETRDGRWWSAAGSHGGYKLRFGLRHARTVTRTPKGFEIVDQLVGARKQFDVEIGFLIHPSIAIARENDRFVLFANGQAIAEIVTPVSLFARIVRDDRESGMGLYSPRFGELVATQSVVASGTMAADPVLTRIDILR